MAVDDVWKQLGEPVYVVAPMVDASELAWRMLCRNHGAHLCYTPMLHSSVFIRDPKYRRESLATCPQDRPLIIQFCGNDPEILLQAASHVESFCDCIDLNLGCPQSIAKRGHYGAYLQDDWNLLSKIVKLLRQSIKTPISCKIRIFEDISKSIDYARMLESSGCQLLTVHGRTRDQKGPLTGTASWEHIKAVKEAVNIPVIANGNIQCLNDVVQCLNITRCDAVMSAEGILHNPALFEGKLYPCWEIALEYLQLTDLYPCPLSYIRGHLFKLFQHLFVLTENIDLRYEIAKGHSKEEFKETVNKIKSRYKSFHEGKQVYISNNSDSNLLLPPWICQPWVRMAPEDHIKKMKEIQNRDAQINFNNISNKKILESNVKRTLDENFEANEVISKKLRKKLMKKSSIKPHCKQFLTKCISCPNPVNLRCKHKLCKSCCRIKCINEDIGCLGHRIRL